MTTEQLTRARARAKVTDTLLEAGLVDEARGSLARLIAELGDGAAAEANGGGSEVAPTRGPKAVKHATKRPRAQKPANTAGRKPRSRSSIEGPTQANGKRARRTFTEEQQKDAVARAREIGVAAAAREADVVPSLLRGWMAKHPAVA